MNATDRALTDEGEHAHSRRTAQDVRLTLWNGDELTLAGLQWVDGGVTGSSEVWGQVTIPVNAIRRLSPRRAPEASK
jgi:hypothetical protein